MSLAHQIDDYRKRQREGDMVTNNTGHTTLRVLAKIGDCDEDVAFLTDATNTDIATLRRLRRQDYGSCDVEPISDDGWQNLINLIDAIPALVEAAKAVKARSFQALEGDDLIVDPPAYDALLDALKALTGE